MITIQENLPLAPFTTFKIGGPARYFVEAEDAKSVAEAFEWAEKKNLSVYILGGGSNILFPDRGYEGLIIHIAGDHIHIQDSLVTATAGSVFKKVIDATLEAGLQGMEYMSGIPGSLGGAVRGNAGAFGTEIKDVVVKVKAVNRETGLVKHFHNVDCDFKYRTSFFKTHPEWVILEVQLSLAEGYDPEDLQGIAETTIAKREEKHPQSAKCAGSFFMNPIVTNKKLLKEFEEETGTPSRGGRLPAGWLITHIGLRGKKIGGAEISKRHPNYLVNNGTATADDILILSSFVKTRVRDQLGVQLKEEIQFVGF